MEKLVNMETLRQDPNAAEPNLSLIRPYYSSSEVEALHRKMKNSNQWLVTSVEIELVATNRRCVCTCSPGEP